MGLLGQMGDMYRLQREAKKIKKELAKTHIFSESDGIKVTVTGEQDIVSVEFTDPTIIGDAKRLEKAYIEATNKALKKSQQIAAERMKSVMGGLQGMMGGKQ